MEQSINWALIAPILIVQLILLVLALVDWMKQENTRGPRLLWLFIILFVNILGPILYFLFAKKE